MKPNILRRAAPLLYRLRDELGPMGSLALLIFVAAGDRIGDYRVESITDGEILFTYLPLKTKQSLPL